MSVFKNLMLMMTATAILGAEGCNCDKSVTVHQDDSKQPNILLAISDDQGWPYAGAYGTKFVHTPAFDRVAQEGILFTHGYCPAPQCAPSRASLLTGRNIWQNKEAGTHNGDFPADLKSYPDHLKEAGYYIGYTGKPWGPGKWQIGGRTTNPAGPAYNNKTLKPPTSGISSNDYAANFEEFLKQRPEGKPFCFWFGCHEPHRVYEKGSGLKAGKRLEEVDVPGFLPDVQEVRSDLLDYAVEIEWFDTHLLRMLNKLEEIGELENTIIVVTGDNGMPFPRAKANNYENGTHVPLAIRWGKVVKGGRVVDDFVSFIDLAPTFLEAAGLSVPQEITGKSIMNILRSEKGGQVDASRDHVVTGIERHAVARIGDVGYPMRAIRTHDYLYIINYRTERWPAGNPDLYGDIDDSPTKSYMIGHQQDEHVKPLFDLAFEKRPSEELYDVRKDPACIDNLADNASYATAKKTLRNRLERILKAQKDPRMQGEGDIFQTYPHYGKMQKLKQMKEER